MPNAEIITKNEGAIKWLNAAKTGATAQTLALNKGGLRATVDYPETAILTDAAAFDHWKYTTADPTTSVVISALYRDRLASLLDTAASGFQVVDAGKSAAYGTIYHEGTSGGITDVIAIPNQTLMGYTISSADDGNMIELSFQGAGAPTNSAVTVSSSAISPTNTETVVKAESYVKWKSSGSTGTPAAKTLGFIQSWRLQVTLPKLIVRQTPGTFSHVKSLGAPKWSLNVTYLYQDGSTSYLFDTAQGFLNKTNNKTVPYGTVAVESLYNTGSVGESIQFTNAVLSQWDFGQAEQGDTLALTFNGVGSPTFASATLA